MRVILLVPLLLAATPAGLQPGLWEMTSAPGQASLDGHPLGDLPYARSTAPDRRCIAAAGLSDPAALIARQAPDGCTIARRTVTGGRATLTGTCPPQAPGLARGSFRLDGRWTQTSYTVRFTTENPSENGRMGFSGTVSAHRVGACP